MPNSTTATASLHALTERLASQSRSLHPFINSGGLPLPPNFPSPQALAQAANAYRQPAPPPSLPSIQIQGRHQEPSTSDPTNGDEKRVGVVRCPEGRAWQEKNRHASERLGRFSEAEMDGFVDDMGMILRKEYDCWVEQCWQEAFHHLFTHTLPNLIIHLIMTGSTPNFLRRKIVYGGQQLDHLFQSQMLHLLYEELEKRLSGLRPHSNAEAGPSTLDKLSTLALPTPPSAGGAPSANQNSLYRDGVCFHGLSHNHGIPEEEDDHGPCLCQLTTCLNCFRNSARQRKGPTSLLPYELKSTRVANGWLGGIESEEQSKLRQDSLKRKATNSINLPSGKGFIQNSKSPNSPTLNSSKKVERGPQIFPHPQMTDVLAVEEHLRWRLKELGARDPAVETRYGPSTNHPIALDGIDLPAFSQSEDGISEDGSVKSAVPPSKAPVPPTTGNKIKVAKGRGGKLRKMIINPNGTVPKSKENSSMKDGKKAVVYLPKEWTEEEAAQRNTAIVLTFRHFVKLLHQISTAASPFSYPSYAKDIDELQRVHPIALYRRLAEPSVQRRDDPNELRAWQGCMEKWAEELGGKERKRGNEYSNSKDHASAVRSYTRAISLDGKKTVYYSNRAIALNNLGEFEKAEQDCNYLLKIDNKNQKALYQRAISRKGLGKLKLAEMDLEELLKQTDYTATPTPTPTTAAPATANLTTNTNTNSNSNGISDKSAAATVVPAGNESARNLRNSLYR
ncbi:uncharacterized protein I303_103423 [Kwoniella dejecticola CBS 10117]|uniref:Uncharacterized protein n=1 Tax=Kwoniella dejecticola CBS 10117 TaxID=1296121 RepID=A0A1A6A6P9_9TREE|nr:uncharacterized protein I303_03445 [Kwoniella dejecticola CBS 10117]OBR85734.1 hypothetical protein I303_03445 [Kwoniella dejecticola CBS 10117]